MAASETRTCTDCQGALGEINVIDHGHYNKPLPIQYATIEAKPSVWTGGMPISGTVKSFMCSQCGLIKQYGVPATH